LFPDYRWLCRDPDVVGAPAPPAPELPTLASPGLLPATPPNPAGAGERLVTPEHRRIRLLAAYWHAGWRHAGPRVRVRAGVARRLGAVADALPDRFGLAIFDGWRPLALQREIFDVAYADASLPPGFVSPPSADPATPPPHPTGGAVDLTLTFDHEPLALGTAFDDFTAAAHAAAFEGAPGRVRELRRLLFWAMRAGGFVVLDCEWWHFEYGTRLWAALEGSPPRYGAAAP
jgi:D-alanyl-D-alanine dipeptidase